MIFIFLYLFGIKYEDDFRYNTIYNIKWQDETIIQIIDKPRFSDICGIKKDIEITEKIWQIFINKLNSNMWLCFVAQSCNLNANLKYIFNCILDLEMILKVILHIYFLFLIA